MQTLEDVLEEITPDARPRLRRRHGASGCGWVPARRKRRLPRIDLARSAPAWLRPLPRARCSRSLSPSRDRRRQPGESTSARSAAPVVAEEPSESDDVGRHAAAPRRRSRPARRRQAGTSPPAPRSAGSSAPPQLTLASDPPTIRRPRGRDLPHRRPPRRLRPAARPSPRARRTSAAACSSSGCPPTSSSRRSTTCRGSPTVRSRSESGNGRHRHVRLDPRPVAHRAALRTQPAAPARAAPPPTRP